MPRRRRRQYSSRRRTGSRRASTGSSIDVDAVIERVIEEALPVLGLDILGLTRDQYREMLKPIVEGILSTYSSRPSIDSIVAKLRSNINNLYVMASAYILEKLDELTEEQLEFVVANGGIAAARHASKIYKFIERYGRRDLLGQLRALWETYGSPTPLTCPYCGFRAVTPELTCIVCGREVRERDLKKAIDFRERLVEFAELADTGTLREVLEKGYVLVGEDIRPPGAPRTGMEAEIRLSEEEKTLIRDALVKRRLGSRG